MAGSRRHLVANKIHDVREYNGHSEAARKEGPMPFKSSGFSSQNLSRARARARYQRLLVLTTA